MIGIVKKKNSSQPRVSISNRYGKEGPLLLVPLVHLIVIVNNSISVDSLCEEQIYRN